VKYTPEKERIEVNVNVLGDKTLNISVKNTGIGIKSEYFSTLFDRFEVLNQIEKQASTGNYPRHGIGLALCKSIANILQGDIQLRSDGTTFTLFEVSLPNLELTASGTVPEDHQDDFTHPPGPVMPTPAEATPGIEAKTKETIPNIPDNPFILVVEDDAEIRFMIKDLLSSDYQIVEASNGKEALQVVNQKHPLLIISDIIMPEMDGVEFVKVMKADEFTSHIPIILLSSKSSIDNQIEGFESGADAYINKPFNFRHLEVMIKNLLHKKEILKEYGTSPYSALEQYEGSLIHKEDKDLILHITQIIHDNIDSEELTIDFIANETAVSKIQLYRKIKEITKKTPTEFIRAIRLKHASKLLKTTNKTVQEVLYDSGFNNKAYFYREFFKQYNMTPKEYRESVDLSLPRD
jgi:DNA-binding response OmpR family regulator